MSNSGQGLALPQGLRVSPFPEGVMSQIPSLLDFLTSGGETWGFAGLLLPFSPSLFTFRARCRAAGWQEPCWQVPAAFLSCVLGLSLRISAHFLQICFTKETFGVFFVPLAKCVLFSVVFIFGIMP